MADNKASAFRQELFTPGHRTHATINLFLGLPLALASLKYTVASSPSDTFAFAAAFIYGTCFLHPDLDLARNIRLLSLKGLLTFPFRPYSYLFRHRGISHMLVIGTLTRVLWLIGFVWFLFTALNWVYPHAIRWDEPPIWFGFAGLAIADFFHVFLDRFLK